MAINYSVAGLKNPNPMSEGEVKYYAKAQASARSLRSSTGRSSSILESREREAASSVQ